MTKQRAIGIDISTHYVRAIQVARHDNDLQIERVFAAPTRRSTDSTEDLLRKLITQHGFDPHAQVAVSLPSQGVFYRDLSVDLDTRDRLADQEYTLLRNCFPIETEKMLVEIGAEWPQPNGQQFLLLAAVHTDSVEPRLELLKDAGIVPQRMEPELFAVYAALAYQKPEVTEGPCAVIHVDDAHLTLGIVTDGQIRLIRNTPIHWDEHTDALQQEHGIAHLIARECQVSWQKTFGHELEGHIPLYLSCGHAFSSELALTVEQASGCTTQLLNPLACISIAPQEVPDTNAAIALGLALRSLGLSQTRDVNFLKSNASIRPPEVHLRHEATILGLLVGALVTAWLLGLFVQRAVLESRYRDLKQQIHTQFVETLPQEKHIVKPIQQMEQKLNETIADYQQLRQWMGQPTSLLRVLQQVGMQKPAQGHIKIIDLLLSPNSATLKGTCDTFDQIYQWRNQLEATTDFQAVRIEEPRRDPDSGQVRFTLLITLPEAS